MAALSLGASSAYGATALRCSPARASPAAGRCCGGVVVTAEQNLVGSVVSVAGSKSVVVNVQRQVAHPKYFKRVYLSKKYMAHDEAAACQVGDVVRITQCRPLSARKRFTVTEVLKAAFHMDAPLPGETA
jgi:small subunit ribosomal protein S17